jgi:hypothetical protein
VTVMLDENQLFWISAEGRELKKKMEKAERRELHDMFMRLGEKWQELLTRQQEIDDAYEEWCQGGNWILEEHIYFDLCDLDEAIEEYEQLQREYQRTRRLQRKTGKK